MENFIKTYMGMVIGLLFTLTALSLTVWTIIDWGKEFDSLKGVDTVYVEQTDIPKEVLYSGSQVIAKTYQAEEDEVIITVNGVEIATRKDAETYQSSIPLHKKYTYTTEVGPDGKVKKIHFKTKGV